MRYSYKGTYGYGIDQDELPETDDLSIVDVKFEQLSDDLVPRDRTLRADDDVVGERCELRICQRCRDSL